MTSRSIDLQISQALILLVESDAGLRRALHVLLMARGYNVKAYAEDTFVRDYPMGRERTCLIAEHRPTHVDGIKLLRLLRAAGWHHPAILITTDHSAETERSALGAGYAHILRKPFAHHVLVGLVDGALVPRPG